jgi:hypothetical protein
MSENKVKRNKSDSKEMQSIRNLLILQLLRDGATSEEIDKATRMGAGNIRAMFPGIKKKAKVEEAE